MPRTTVSELSEKLAILRNAFVQHEHEMRRLNAEIREVKGKIAPIQQEQFNQKLVDILDQLTQEMERQRRGSGLSNLAGIRGDIMRLIQQLWRTERPSARPVSM